MSLILIGIILLISGTIISLFFKKNIKIRIYSIFLILSSLSFIISVIIYLFLAEKLKISYDLNDYFSLYNMDKFNLLVNLNLGFTKLGSYFIFVFSLVVFSIALYIPYYIGSHNIDESKLNFHLFNFTILLISILSLFLSKNMLLFLILWELMGISSFLCIFFDGKKTKTINAAILYLIMMHISFIFLLIATILTYDMTHTFSFDLINEYFNNDSIISIKLKSTIFYLFTIGFIIKLGIFPFHFWLAEAHPASPTHLSSFMSSIVIKTGFYGLLLITKIFGFPSNEFSKIIIFAGLTTSLIGIINATSQNQIKKFLAYSSVENAGLLLFFYGSSIYGFLNNNYFLFTCSFLAIFIFLMNHAFSKSSAFLVSGIVITETKNDNLNNLGGIINYYKDASSSSFLSSISLSALPPFGNFIAELLIFIAYANFIINNIFSITPFIVFLFLGLIGAITILAFTRYFSVGYLGTYRGNNQIEKKKFSVFLKFSIFLNIFFAVILSSPYFFKIYFSILKEFSNNFEILNNQYLLESEMQQINSIIIPFYNLLILFFVIIIFFSIFYSFLKVKKCKTWGCGYIIKEKDNFQYSATSFVQPFLTIFKSLTGLKIRKKESDIIFSKDAHIESEHHDIIQKNLLSPALEKLNEFLDRFTFIQSGKTQHYILYGLIFLIIIIIWIFIKYI